MKKIVLILFMSFIVTNITPNLTSCFQRKIGWQNNQEYWGVLNLQNFTEWIKKCKLNSNSSIEAWNVINNVYLNNFMTIMDLLYQYFLTIEYKNNNEDNLVKMPMIAIDSLTEFEPNFQFSILNDKNSFFNFLTNLKKEDQPFLKWKAISEIEFKEKWPKLNSNNSFKTIDNKEINMQILTINNKNFSINVIKKIIDFWKRYSEIESNLEINEVWKEMHNIINDSILFNLRLFWPSKTEPEKNLNEQVYINYSFRLSFLF